MLHMHVCIHIHMYAGVKDKAPSTTLTKSSPKPSKVKLFISYAWEECTNEFVIKLKGDLEDHGFEVFLDKVDIVVGQNIQHELARQMDEANGIIAVFSKKFSSSEWCDKELQMAQRHNKPFFPVRRIREKYSNNLDIAMGSIKWADFINESEYEDSLKALIQGIEKM